VIENEEFGISKEAIGALKERLAAHPDLGLIEGEEWALIDEVERLNDLVDELRNRIAMLDQMLRNTLPQEPTP
jgi:hypothetical protein